MEHKLYVIFKGFANARAEREAERRLAIVPYVRISTRDLSFDLGAYAEALPSIDEERVCFLNTNVELCGEDWLAKLISNLDQPRVGMVSATGSYESLFDMDFRFPKFPNPHLRSNAFALRRVLANEVFRTTAIKTKLDAYLLESGPGGITRQVMMKGLTCLIVGRDGRGYGPDWWAISRTFRLGRQENLLVHDNMTREFDRLTVAEKVVTAHRTWGRLDRPINLLEG